METATEKTSNNLLDDLDFNDDISFFGIKSDKNNQDDIIKEVKQENRLTDKSSEKTTEIKEVKTDDDDDLDDDVFKNFGAEPTKAKAKKIVKQEDEENEEKNTEEVKKTKPIKSKVAEEVEEEKFFEDSTEEIKTSKTDKGKDDELTEEEKDEKFYTTLAEELKQKGVFQNIEIPKDKVLTEDEFIELQDKELDLRLEEALEDLVKGLDEDAKRFLKFKKNGGSTHEFLNTYTSTLGLDTLDDADPKQVDKVLNYYIVTTEGLEGEELEDRLKFIKEGGKAKVYANKWFDKIKAEEEEEKNALDEAVKTALDKKEASAKKFNTELAEVAQKTEAVGVFTFTKSEIKGLINNITKPTVKVGKNKFVPAFNAKLGQVLQAKTDTDKQKLLVLAKLIDNDFDIKDIVITAKTKVTKETKEVLKDAKQTVKAHTSGRLQKKELSDYWDS